MNYRLEELEPDAFEKVTEYELQYILSVTKSDLPTDNNDLPKYFSQNDVILSLHDRDESGTLFGFEF